MTLGTLVRQSVAGLVVLALMTTAAESMETPSGVVRRLQGALLEVMKQADALGPQGRYERLEPTIASAMDFARMVRIAVGSFWRKASADEQSRLLREFKRMSVGTYASQFDGYDGETFEIVTEKPGPRNTALVATRIIRRDKEPAEITYVLLQSEDRWQIVDVLLDNSVSQLAVRRSEFRRLLRDSGVGKLIATLGAKTDELISQ